MATLESVVLPLEQSRFLAEKGIVLDTAMVWVPVEELDEYRDGENSENREPVLMERRDTLDEDNEPMYESTSAPVLSELLDAIRARDKNVEICLYGAGAIDAWSGGTPYVLTGSTDLLAACALLLEVSK